jgi:hypothetical protein
MRALVCNIMVVWSNGKKMVLKELRNGAWEWEDV